MDRYDLGHLPPAELIRGADALAASDRGTTAELVAHIAEIDAQRLYEGLGFESTYAYCLGRLRLSEDAAYKRIQVARVARKYRRLFRDLEEGRLNLSLVCLLAPHLKPDNVEELVATASHKTNAETRAWLENRLRPAISVPSPGVRQLTVPLPQLAVQQVRAEMPVPATAPLAPEPEPVGEPGPPLEYQMTFTITSEDHERFRYAQALLSHAIPSGDVAAVFRRAIEAVIAECKKRKVAATSQPRTRDRRPAVGRSVPAEVRRAVWKRDARRCTFVTPSGHRCDARRLLEFDHIVPVARGGPSTADNVRLRCRAHNQEAARNTLGARFMNGKRRAAAAERRERAAWKANGLAPPSRGP
jgi:5-methylcytosine-specific restriction endonuclease McrA